ncbi:MAG: hypothetical protein K2L00_08090 [Muribaculaceae bacterium]|nr:hypothetical protein [Muribaculaceae bacterium]
MNKTYLSIMAAMAVAAAAPSDASSAQSVDMPSLLRVERIEVAHIDTLLQISFDIDPHRVKPGSDRQVMFTPIVRSLDADSKDSIALRPVTFAGRNRYYTHLREGDIAAGDLIYQAGQKGQVGYSRSVAWQPWMDNCTIYMREETQNCCKPVKPLCDTPLAKVVTPVPEVDKDIERIDYIALTGDSAVVLEAEGKAFIDFVVNRTEIKENYRNNPRELRTIIESIDAVKNDPDAVITRLTVKGFASPEGSYENNVRLAIGRTESRKEYVRERYNFDPKIMFADYEPEDWDGLREWLLRADIPNRDGILGIVNSGLAPDPKDAAIKKTYPKQYKLLLDSVYPALRHSDYTVQYRIKTYMEIEEFLEAYNKTPNRLRPVDFFRVAQIYDPGTKEFDDVLLKASEIYPNDQQAAINAANILMRRGDMQKASEKLINAGESGEAYYSRAMLAKQNGDDQRALAFFQKAWSLGYEKAADHIEQLETSAPKQMIMYMIEESGE